MNKFIILLVSFFLGFASEVTALDVFKGVQEDYRPQVQADSVYLSATEPGDIVLGSAAAPATIVAYSSMTCDHCAEFHVKILPKLKEKYIVPGKLRVVLRHFPIDQFGFKAALVVSSLPKDQQEEAMTQLFTHQDDWISEKFDQEVSRLTKLSVAHIQKVTNDKTLHKRVIDQRLNAEKRVQAQATPFFIINGKPFEGFLELREFEDLLRAALPS